MKLIFHFLAVVILTVTTQIGGFIYLAVLVLFRNQKWWMSGLVFFVTYLFISIGLAPFLAPHFGREKVEIEVLKSGYVLANRNYVTPELNEALKSIEQSFQLHYPELKLVVLDANFPFFDGFPLLPHLSHDDGKKIDLAFVYETKDGELTNRQKSRSGYGAFTFPDDGEVDQARLCAQRGSWQYGMTAYFSFGAVNPDLVFSERANRKLLEAIVAEERIGKVFVEPHLRDRLGVFSDKIRFQGCHSVRHDDHFHIQLK